MVGNNDLSIHVEYKDSAVIVRPAGDIDLSRSPALRRELSSVQQRQPARLVVDLRDVPYMDSSGVATLVEALQVARRSDSDVVLCDLQDRVRSIFEIARLDTVFTIRSTLEEALR